MLRYDVRLLEALGEGRTITAAAQAAGISRRTATRRMADSGFVRQLADLRATNWEMTYTTLSALGPHAVGVLGRAMAENTDPGRIRAAQVLLDAIMRARPYDAATVAEASSMTLQEKRASIMARIEALAAIGAPVPTDAKPPPNQSTWRAIDRSGR